MLLKMFAVFDLAVTAYLPPFFARSRGEALRSFVDACNDEKHQFHRNAKDYFLYELGVYDDATGFVDCEKPERVISALECLVENELPAPQPASVRAAS